MECVALVLVPIAIKFIAGWDKSPKWLNITLIVLEFLVGLIILFTFE